MEFYLNGIITLINTMINRYLFDFNYLCLDSQFQILHYIYKLVAINKIQ